MGAIRRLLPQARVGTVDKFQGQEAPISLYSMATSSPEDAPRGMDLLYSRNRLNVATPRAALRWWSPHWSFCGSAPGRQSRCGRRMRCAALWSWPAASTPDPARRSTGQKVPRAGPQTVMILASSRSETPRASRERISRSRVTEG
ncbi:MAG: AAA domain-containing protein [Armatimonadota bacterium]